MARLKKSHVRVLARASANVRMAQADDISAGATHRSAPMKNTPIKKKAPGPNKENRSSYPVVVRGERALTDAELPLHPWVTVTISTYHCPERLLLDAVQSILNQSYRHLRLVVVADGDPGATKCLSNIRDPRLLTHEYGPNRGQFFAHQLVALATDDPCFAIQDADDESPLNRIARQVELLVEHGADMVVTGVINHQGSKTWRLKSWPDAKQREDKSRIPFFGCHMGIYRTSSLLEVGGYLSGIRLGFDTMVLCILKHHGRMAFTDEPLYVRYVRPRSMTTSKETGLETERRRLDRLKLSALYDQVLSHANADDTRKLIEESIPSEVRDHLHREVQVLADRMRQQKTTIEDAARGE